MVNHAKSDWHNIKCGVQLGSTFRPLLFLVYINDLSEASNLQVKLFADDAVFTCTHKLPNQLKKIVNEELSQTDEWMTVNELSINYKKTNYMILTKKKINHFFDINIRTTPIDQKSHAKYLRVILDNQLYWKEHVKHLTRKLARGSWDISKLKKYVDTKTLMLVYYSLIYSQLQYCITSWVSAPKTVLKPIIVIQNRVVRMVTESHF